MSGPCRAAVAVLAFVAVALAAFLTWTTFGQQTIAGCDGMGVVDCDAVLQSSWSKWLGLPVAAAGLVSYAAILVLSLLTAVRRPAAAQAIGTTLVMLALLAAGSAIWFTALQVMKIGQFCPYCLGIHLCGMLIAGLVLWSALRGRPDGTADPSNAALAAAIAPGASARRSAAPHAAYRPLLRPLLGLASLGALVMLGLLVGGQVLFPAKTFEISTLALAEQIDMEGPADAADDANPSPSAQSHVVNRVSDEDPADDPEEENETGADDPEGSPDTSANESPTIPTPDVDQPARQRKVSFLGGKLTIDMYKEAVVGSPESPYVVIELIDYTCPHCREMHRHIKRAVDRYGDQLAVVIMPVPLELECNKIVPKTDPAHRGSCRLSRLALALAKADPNKFGDFHNWLMADKDNVPSTSKAVIRAFGMVDRKRLSELTTSDAINDRIQRNIRLYAALSRQHSDTKKSFGLPVQVLGDGVLTGKIENVDEMFDEWEKALGIQPQ